MDILIPILNDFVFSLMKKNLSSFLEQKENSLSSIDSLLQEKIAGMINHPLFNEYYSSLCFAETYLREYSSVQKEKKINFEEIKNTSDLTQIFITLFKQVRKEEPNPFFNLALERILSAINNEKIIISDLLNKSTSYVKGINLQDSGSKGWNTENKSLKTNTLDYWIINDKGTFVEFPTIFSLEDKKELELLNSKKNLKEEETLRQIDLTERSDVQNYCRMFENRLHEIICGFSIKGNKTFLPKKEKYTGNIKDFLKNSYPKMKKDVGKYNEYRKTVMFLETIFLKENFESFFAEKNKVKLEIEFLDAYWEVVRDKYFWNKVNITDSKKSINNFAQFKLEKTLGKYNPDLKLNCFIRSLFIFVLKQIRRRVDNRLFTMADQLAKYYKPQGFFKKFEDEVEKGRIFAGNPEKVAENYLYNDKQNIKKENVVKYVTKVRAVKTLYNRMDMRSTFLGQQLKTDYNHCFKNKEIVSLIEKRRNESIKLKKDKEVVKILPKKV